MGLWYDPSFRRWGMLFPITEKARLGYPSSLAAEAGTTGCPGSRPGGRPPGPEVPENLGLP